MKSIVIILLILAWVGLALVGGAVQEELDQASAAVDKPTEVIPREGCVTAECHAVIKDYTFLHGPLYVNACDGCHSLTSAEEHAFELFRPREELCKFCHTLDLGDAEYLHEPLNTGDCLSCHNPHGSAEPALLKGENYSALCQNCHEEEWDSLQSVHGPVAAGACGACHEAHGSRFPKLLEEEGRELCLQCHISTATTIDAAHYVHGPVEVECRVCHDPHASTHALLLLEDPVELCESCHENIRLTVDSATTKHAAVTTEQACLNCHTAHASDYPRMLKANPITLCFECHDQEVERPDGTIVRNMKALLESGKTLHGPTAQDSCVVCHQIHGGGHERLLIQEFPSHLYYPFNEEVYSLCFSCHDRNLVLLAETRAVTNFRNGEMNLHYVHVKDEKKGRSCGLCHDAHAGDREHHIRSRVPFGPGGWELPIDFVATATGGSCAAGCHVAHAYDRVVPVEYIPLQVPPDYKDQIIHNGGAKKAGEKNGAAGQ